MACSSCQKRQEQIAQQKQMENKSLQQLFDTGEFEVVKYVDFGTSTRIIGLPTTAAMRYGKQSYGNAKPGTFLLVHKDDIKAAPQKFVVITNQSVYQSALESLGLQKPQQFLRENVIQAPTNIVVIDEKAALNELLNETFEEEVPEVILVESAPVIEQEGIVLAGNSLYVRLKRSEAMPLAQFRDTYGFTHHIAVMARVRTGELKSFKDGTITYIYHDEN